MSQHQKPPPLPGDMSSGVLGKAVTALSWLAITTLMLAITSIPSILLLIFLYPDDALSVTNALVIAVSLALLGPAISAGVYSARAQEIDETPAPFRAFWRGKKMNFADVMRLWLPASLVIGVIALAIGVAAASGMAIGNIALIVLAGAVLIWALHALVISTFISMTTGGVARLAMLYIGRTPKVTFGVLAAIVAAGLVASVVPGGIFVVVVGAALLVMWLYYNAKPMIADVTEHFTVQGAAPHDALL